jgi:hypothetical protein
MLRCSDCRGGQASVQRAPDAVRPCRRIGRRRKSQSRKGWGIVSGGWPRLAPRAFDPRYKLTPKAEAATGADWDAVDRDAGAEMAGGQRFVVFRRAGDRQGGENREQQGP